MIFSPGWISKKDTFLFPFLPSNQDLSRQVRPHCRTIPLSYQGIEREREKERKIYGNDPFSSPCLPVWVCAYGDFHPPRFISYGIYLLRTRVIRFLKQLEKREENICSFSGKKVYFNFFSLRQRRSLFEKDLKVAHEFFARRLEGEPSKFQSTAAFAYTLICCCCVVVYIVAGHWKFLRTCDREAHLLYIVRKEEFSFSFLLGIQMRKLLLLCFHRIILFGKEGNGGRTLFSCHVFVNGVAPEGLQLSHPTQTGANSYARQWTFLYTSLFRSPR